MLKNLLFSVILMMGFASASFGQVDWDAEYDNTYICFDYKIHVYIARDSAMGMVTMRDKTRLIIKRFFMRGHPDLYSCESDPLGLKVPVAVFYAYTGGAHCCQTFSYWSLGQTAVNLLTYEKGNAYDWPKEHYHEDIDHDGIMEIISTDDSFQDHSYCYICVRPLRIVFCYKNGRYDDCTAQYPDVIRKELKSLTARRKTEPLETGLAITFHANYLLLNEEDKWLAEARLGLSKNEFRIFNQTISETRRLVQDRKEKITWSE